MCNLGNKIIIANAGDSRAMMVVKKNNKSTTDVISFLNKNFKNRILIINDMNPFSYLVIINRIWMTKEKG
jgi:serine/threonine protein phosphatase PrpC